MTFNFDEIIDRTNTGCLKYDARQSFFSKSDVIPMWVADMDFRSAPEIIDALITRAHHGVFGYTYIPESFYQSIISWFHRRFDCQLERDWIVFSPGVVPALNLSVLCFSHPGDGIIVQPPVYHPFMYAVSENDRVVKPNRLLEKNGKYEIDFDDLEKKASEARMIILCNPHNPVGRVWTTDELSKIAELSRRYNLIVVSDEIHCDLVYKPNKHIPFLKVAKGIEDKTVVCISPSKTFNIAGLTSSAVIIPDRELRNNFSKRLSNLDICANIFGLTAFEAAYNFGEEWLESLLVYLEKNIDFVISYMGKHLPEIKVIKPEATYLLWLDFRNLRLSHSELMKMIVQQANVGLSNGKIFGEGGDGFMRMNIGCPQSVIKIALENIRGILHKN